MVQDKKRRSSYFSWADFMWLRLTCWKTVCWTTLYTTAKCILLRWYDGTIYHHKRLRSVRAPPPPWYTVYTYSRLFSIIIIILILITTNVLHPDIKKVTMDRAGNPATSADFAVLAEAHPDYLSPTDPEARGRRRRRDPAPVYTTTTTLQRPRHMESSTLRGRGRRRSPSCVNMHNNNSHFMLLAASRAASPRVVRHRRRQQQQQEATTTEEAEDVLGLLGGLRPENHRRSQSPSRSRRRQRTQSRSRPHGQAGARIDAGLLMEAKSSSSLSSRLLGLAAAEGSARGQG